MMKNIVSDAPQFPIDINQREQMRHGTDAFPCMWYVDQYFNNGYPAHWHNELEIGTVQKGTLYLEINGQNYILQKGDSIFVNSCTLHGYKGEVNTETLFANILFQASLVYGARNSVLWEKYMSPVLEHSQSSFCIIPGNTPEGGKMAAQIIEICNLMRSREWGWEFLVRNCLSDIFLCISRSMQYVYDMEEKHESKNLQRIRLMTDYVQEHYTEPVALEQIANAAAISTRECIRCFQNTLRLSPKQYLMKIRIRRACVLLENSEMRILDICEQCGFQDQSYFTKIFRREKGCSPGSYRRRIRGEISTDFYDEL